MCKFINFQTWFVLSLFWTAAMAYLGYAEWPRVVESHGGFNPPLDISPADGAALASAAYHTALLKHSLCYGAVAAVPPLVALLAGRRMCAGRA
jgi:hypothetical protein